MAAIMRPRKSLPQRGLRRNSVQLGAVQSQALGSRRRSLDVTAMNLPTFSSHQIASLPFVTPHQSVFHTLCGKINEIEGVGASEGFSTIPLKSIHDSQLFEQVWKKVEKRKGKIALPKEIIWLAGAPGSGKGTNIAHFLKARNIAADPIVMSSLLDSDMCRAVKAAGGLVDDSIVLEALLEELAGEQYAQGVVVDGFPRSPQQVNFVHLLHNKHSKIQRHVPNYSVAVLHVSKEESISRQLSRGLNIQMENVQRALQGLPLLEVRTTDLDHGHAATRYEAFSDSYDNLLSMKNFYPFMFVDASGSKDEVQRLIEMSFAGEIRNVPVEELGDDDDDLTDASTLIPAISRALFSAAALLPRQTLASA